MLIKAFKIPVRHLNDIRILRFAIGTTLAIAIVFSVNWPLSFVTPLFVAKFLSSPAPKLPPSMLIKIFGVMAVAFLFAEMVTVLLLPYPLVFMAIMTLVLFRVFYWNQNGGNGLMITMLLIGVTVIPMLGLVNLNLSSGFVLIFLFSGGLALLISLLMHELISDSAIESRSGGAPAISQKEEKSAANKPEEENLQTDNEKLRPAIISTSIVMPLYLLFFMFELTASVLILAFVTMMAQSPDLVSGKKGTMALLAGNSIGGLVAIIFYQLLIAVPSFTFLIMGFLLLSLVFGKIIFSDKPSAPLFTMGFTTVILLISSATSSIDASGTGFYQRIIQIAAACGYVIIMVSFSGMLTARLKSRGKAKNLETGSATVVSESADSFG